MEPSEIVPDVEINRAVLKNVGSWSHKANIFTSNIHEQFSL